MPADDGWDHPVFATREEFDARTDELLAEEADNPEEWWYMSFVGEDEFLGGLYVKAKGQMHAIATATMLKLNPGGEVAFWGPFSDETMDANVAKGDRWRLLSKEEVEGE